MNSDHNYLLHNIQIKYIVQNYTLSCKNCNNNNSVAKMILKKLIIKILNPRLKQTL